MALFCFPCLFFGGDSSWSKTGFKTIGKLKEKLKKHEQSKAHMDNLVSYAMVGTAQMRHYLSDAYRQTIEAHNAQVTKNREVLSHIIETVFLCGFCEVGLRGHDESGDSANPGVYRRILRYGAKLNPTLLEHYESSSVFKGTSKTVQNEVLECALKVYKDIIMEEVAKSKHLAVIADESTDASGSLQLVIVFRHVVNNQPKERFWGFFRLQAANAEAISAVILERLKVVLKDDVLKLVAQTFDGAAVMRGDKSGVQVNDF